MPKKKGNCLDGGQRAGKAVSSAFKAVGGAVWWVAAPPAYTADAVASVMGDQQDLGRDAVQLAGRSFRHAWEDAQSAIKGEECGDYFDAGPDREGCRK